MTPVRDEQGLVGTVLADRYRLTGLLGVGGMGSVYRADDLALGRPLAIKVLRKHLGTIPEAAARFRREAFVGEKLVHPNCVEIADAGRTGDGHLFLAMALIDGESLGDVIDREGPMPWRRALGIARHVLRGLGHAHEQSVVHRDIKPDNIYVGRHADDPDFAWVLDFGIAKLIDDVGQEAITQAGITIGTPNYLSPEQAVGGVVDGRSDLYSLSVVLYEMLTGRAPFAGREPLKTALAHATEAPPPFALDLDVPAEVQALVMDGLVKSADERIGSAGEYIVRIDELLGPEPRALARGSTSPPIVEARPPPPRRRWRAAVIAGAAVLAVGAAVAIVRASRAADVPLDAPTLRLPPPPPDPRAVDAALAQLRRGKTCAIRREAVATLLALGDPSVIPALEKARTRVRRGKNLNACLRADADAAIEGLSRRGR